MANYNIIKKTKGDIVFDVVNTIFMLALVFITLYPMYYVLCASFSNNVKLLANPGALWYPQGFNLGAYKLAFKHPLLLSGYKNILIVLGVSLPINIILTLFCGYFLAAKRVLFKKPILAIIMFTMFFNGGMIPTYLNVRSLGLFNSLWALILPGAMSVYNAIICKTAIEGIPDSLTESAYIDGANDILIIFRIILPLIMPTIAVLLLYYGIGHWNSWFSASLYIQDNTKLPIQNVLRAVLIANSNILNSAATEDDQINQFAETIKYSAIVISTVPVLFLYPFLQKYFVKGALIGAVKG
ncbi:sugar ABC transporter permease [Clostridium thermosuccinogenes]|jgi:putative aldouronate transport system permease protein|uniref:Sugar ABC transporter permease n=1 Tax=Clostridium thermosuccinogenes TaxID=84032 RepID=A0A2K2FMS9_9CLOT|nr:carbohydrate ABC transporter permease [Pseudoclostridium thermosuccinogenes]AUS97741.1 sugar ABC transporter permease [Pseudoclostridium thermosuccinogenes]PNT93983.1 sugar ABC transporter permease [Pseudoclostridium thermosuccinogenes]PNT98105.1 sugar ABC transporter permease [Pseudoclostridium thermosuccinogenes]PNU00076.1 sugar ABC transporter permease [Pseudoclostridium thermosuccinogenes]